MSTVGNIINAVDQFARESGLERNAVIGILEESISEQATRASTRIYGVEKELQSRFNNASDEFELFEFRTVVEKVTDPEHHITVADARKQGTADAEAGEQIGVKVNLAVADFGRIAAQAIKQAITQIKRAAERKRLYDEYKDREGEIITGIMRRYEKSAMIVDLGHGEAVMPMKEQIPRETFRPNDRLRAFVVDVNNEPKGAQIILSRASEQFLKKLFAQEVPEIYEGLVYIHAASREPGGRSKIAVASHDNDVDPVGACVGVKGSRVQAVVQELRGERIDIVPYNEDPVRFVCSALSPADVAKVIIDEAAHSMGVIVPDDQLSLAIGRRGQNVRLAVQLTGWKIDIQSETKMREMVEWFVRALAEVPDVGEAEADALLQNGVTSLENLAEIGAKELGELLAASPEQVQQVQAAARKLAVEKAEADARAAEEAAKAAALAEVAEAAAEDAAAEGSAQPRTPRGGRD